MVYRPWQRDSAEQGHVCGSERRAQCGCPPAGAARWENQSLHGVGGGGWPPGLGGPGGLLLGQSQGVTYLDTPQGAPEGPGPAWWLGNSIPPRLKCTVWRGLISAKIPVRLVREQVLTAVVSGPRGNRFPMRE